MIINAVRKGFWLTIALRYGVLQVEEKETIVKNHSNSIFTLDRLFVMGIKGLEEKATQGGKR